jgi:hypothetical protein
VFESVVAVVDAYELKQGADLIAGVQDFSGMRVRSRSVQRAMISEAVGLRVSTFSTKERKS